MRNNKGNIGKIIGIFDGHCTAKYHIEFQGNVKVKRQYLSTNTITKHSTNIIDLIEVGDYVNGMQIDEFDDVEGNIFLGFPIYDDALMNCISEFRPLSTVEIHSIVTKEQFTQAEYKIEKGE